MTLTGHVHNKKITIDNKNVNLTEGSLVKIIPLNNIDTDDDLCGSWEDERTAEEIIKDIKKARKNRVKEIIL